jgi:hypothetical protein
MCSVLHTSRFRVPGVGTSGDTAVVLVGVSAKRGGSIEQSCVVYIGLVSRREITLINTQHTTPACHGHTSSAASQNMIKSDRRPYNNLNSVGTAVARTDSTRNLDRQRRLAPVLGTRRHLARALHLELPGLAQCWAPRELTTTNLISRFQNALKQFLGDTFIFRRIFARILPERMLMNS